MVFSVPQCMLNAHVHVQAINEGIEEDTRDAGNEKTHTERGKNGFLIKFGDWNDWTMAFKYAFNVHKQ